MANANTPRGLIPVKRAYGSPAIGAPRTYWTPSTDGTALFYGDPVKLVTDSSDTGGIQTVTRAAAGDVILGVFVGLAMTGGDGSTNSGLTRDTPTYRAASTATYVLVCDDPDVLFEVQEDGAGGVMTVGAVGRNADIIVAAGSTATGYSGTMLDSSDLKTGSAQLRIIEPVRRPDNDPTALYAKWLVMILEHQMRTATGI
jgi:hypothetical protein